MGVVEAVQSVLETDRKRYEKAVRDQKRLQEVGVKSAFGELTAMKRFRNVRYLSPPSPPPPSPLPPPLPPAPPSGPGWFHDLSGFNGGWWGGE